MTLEIALPVSISEIANRSKTSFAQLLIQLEQFRLFEFGPLRDTSFDSLAGLLVESNRLRRHGTIPAFDNTQSRDQVCYSRLAVRLAAA